MRSRGSILGALLLAGAAGAAGADPLVLAFGSAPAGGAPPGLHAMAGEACGLPPLFPDSGRAWRPLAAADFDAFAAQVLGRTNGKCPDALGAATLFASDAQLLSARVHLARERGLEPEACAARSWRIVAVVLDPCGEAAPSGGRAVACQPEIRIVAQPFSQRRGGVVSLDDSLHLIYSVADAAAFERDLRVLRALLAEAAGSPCSVSERDRVLGVVGRHLTRAGLRRIAWSTSSRSGQHWSFGALERDRGAGFHLATLPAGGHFDNFSKPEMLRGACGINRESSSTLRAAFGWPGVAGTTPDPGVEIARLQDPLRSRRSEDLCVGCHMADQVALLPGDSAPLVDRNGLSVFARHGVKLGNQRQIGVRADGAFWLSQRMIRSLRSDGATGGGAAQ